MANIKISQLPAKGANLGSSDLLEVSEFTGTGYVSKSITGQEIIDAIPTGAAWGDITGTLSNQTDLQTELNDKQDTLISGTNIKTINGSSVLGSGDLVIGGGGGQNGGLHIPSPPVSGWLYNNLVQHSSSTMSFQLLNICAFHIFAPINECNISEVSIDVVTAAVTPTNGKILVYTAENGRPYNLLIESPALDLTTTGSKIYTTSVTFEAGKQYYFGFTTDANDSILRIRGAGTLNSIIRYFNYNVPQYGMYFPNSFNSIPAVNNFTGTSSSYYAPIIYFRQA